MSTIQISTKPGENKNWASGAKPLPATFSNTAEGQTMPLESSSIRLDDKPLAPATDKLEWKAPAQAQPMPMLGGIDITGDKSAWKPPVLKEVAQTGSLTGATQPGSGSGTGFGTSASDTLLLGKGCHGSSLAGAQPQPGAGTRPAMCDSAPVHREVREAPLEQVRTGEFQAAMRDLLAGEIDEREALKKATPPDGTGFGLGGGVASADAAGTASTFNKPSAAAPLPAAAATADTWSTESFKHAPGEKWCGAGCEGGATKSALMTDMSGGLGGMDTAGLPAGSGSTSTWKDDGITSGNKSSELGGKGTASGTGEEWKTSNKLKEGNLGGDKKLGADSADAKDKPLKAKEVGEEASEKADEFGDGFHALSVKERVLGSAAWAKDKAIDGAVHAKNIALAAGSKIKEGAVTVVHKITGHKDDDDNKNDDHKDDANDDKSIKDKASDKVGEASDKATELKDKAKDKVDEQNDKSTDSAEGDSNTEKKGVAANIKEKLVGAACWTKDTALSAGSMVKDGAVAVVNKVSELTHIGRSEDDLDAELMMDDQHYSTATPLKLSTTKEIKEKTKLKTVELKEKAKEQALEFGDNSNPDVFDESDKKTGVAGVASTVKEKVVDAAHWTRDTAVSAGTKVKEGAVAVTHKATEVVWGAKADMEGESAKHSLKEGHLGDAASSGAGMVEAEGEKLKAKAKQV